MKLGRVLGYPKLRCDLLVSRSRSKQSKNLSFACSQWIVQVFEILICAFGSGQQQPEEIGRECNQAFAYSLKGARYLTG